jgi:outer membrane receptor protein involved in Fe transport
MKKICFTLFAFLIAFISFGQDRTGKVSGVITDDAGKPIASATVSLFRSADSSLLKTAITNKEGAYDFVSLSPGDYYLGVTSVGFERKKGNPFGVASNSPVTVDPISLSPASQSLAGVTVNATRPFIESKIDKTVVNVDASPTSAGATALEVLEKSPGVMVNNDGIISLRGKAGVIVMLDGKPSFLSPADLANLLKNLPASAIDQIEIMTNPSSKYDASGNSGVINIRTKKGKMAGFNGSVMVGLTTSYFENSRAFYVFPKSQNSINWNYRNGKINFFGNYNPNISRGGAQLEISRNVLDEDKNIVGRNEVITHFRFGNNNHTLKVGLDLFADKKNTFGIVVSGFTFSGHPTPRTTTSSYNQHMQPTSHMISKTRNDNTFRNLTANLNFRHQFDSSGREFTADLDMILYRNHSDMLLTTESYYGNWNRRGEDLLLKGDIPANIDIFSFKSDYTHPLKNGGRIEAGLKSSFVMNDNLVDYERWDGAKWIVDGRSNHFIYDENINAVYLNANQQVKKWSFQGGLRLENTNAKGYQVTNDSTFRRSFTSLFPSAFVSYEVSKVSKLTVSYSRRITRPNYQDLNPFIWFLDSLSYRKGNPFLTPQFTHNFELSHAYKGKYIATLNYNNTTDVISQILKPQGDLVFLTSENVARFRNIGLALTLPFTVSKWWSMNVFGNVFNNHYTGVYENKPLDIEYTSFMVNVTNAFTLKPGFTMEVSGFYRARGVDQLTINDPMYVINFGAQKQVLNGKGTVRLNLRDPFWLQRYSGRTQYNLIDTRIKNRWDNRQVTISFNYRFGKNGQPQQRRRNSASQEEQNRVGGAGQ